MCFNDTDELRITRYRWSHWCLVHAAVEIDEFSWWKWRRLASRTHKHAIESFLFIRIPNEFSKLKEHSTYSLESHSRWMKLSALITEALILEFGSMRNDFREQSSLIVQIYTIKFRMYRGSCTTSPFFICTSSLLLIHAPHLMNRITCAAATAAASDHKMICGERNYLHRAPLGSENIDNITVADGSGKSGDVFQ